MYFDSLLLAVPVFLVSLVPAGARGPTPLLGTKLTRVKSGSSEPPHYKVREIVIQAEPDTACPNGFDQSRGNCVKLDSVPTLLQCPPGWTVADDAAACIGYKTVQPEKTCDRGAPGSDRCLNEFSAPKILSCSAEFSLSQDLSQCVKEVPHTPVEICPPGVNIVNGSCVSVETQLPHTRCPVDTHLNDGICEKLVEVPIKYTCPPGYYSTTGHGTFENVCEKLLEQEPSRRCPAGYLLNGSDCIGELSFPPTYVCPKGTSIDGNRCLVEKFSSPQIQCPPGLQMNGLTQTCEKDDVQLPIAECSKGTHYNPITNQCGDAHKMKQPNLACPRDYHFVGKDHCVKHVSEPPQKVCPPGFELISKDQCVWKEMRLPEARCPEGTHFVGALCISIQNAPFKFLCETGYVLDGNRCVASTRKQPSITCPPDFVPVDGRCLAKSQESPSITCPENAIPRLEAGALLCMVSTTRPAQKTCPVTQRFVNDLCLERVTTQATMRCPPGYFEDIRTGKCFTVEESPQRNFCPVGFRLVNGVCIKQESRPLVPSCPPPYKLNHSPSGEHQCTKEIILPLMKICAFGFQLENNVCLAKKLQYEFDEEAEENEATEPEEAQLPLEAPEMPEKPKDEKEEPEIETTVNRQVVQKGLVMRNEPVVLSGPASEVAKKQALIQAGGDPKKLENVDVEYVPPQPSASNLASLMSILGTH